MNYTCYHLRNVTLWSNWISLLSLCFSCPVWPDVDVHTISVFNRQLVILVYILQCQYVSVNRDSVVGIATSYGLNDREVGVRVPIGSRIFSSLRCPDLGSTQLPIQWVPGALSPGVKRPRREADHSPPTSAEVKKMWIYTSTPSYAFMV
jgi:hypothetical protein